MASTTAPAMKAALLTQLAARANLADPVVVSRTVPPGLGNYYELVSIGGPVSNTTSPAAQGMGATQTYYEEYTATVQISVVHNTNDGAATEDRAYALMKEVEDQLDTDPTVNGTVNAAIRDGYESANRANAAERETFIAMRIKCEAFI